MYLTQLADVLRAHGLKVNEVDGWKTRGRPSGGFNPVGVLCHHTATNRAASDAAVIRLLVVGRSDLPGPLCQLGLGRDGTVHVIAAGRANHAGTAKSSGTVAAGDGNSLYIGVEAFNDGVGEPWPQVQYDAYVKLCAVLSVKVTGNSVNTVRAHKETSVTGKIDPRFDMGQFRERVQAEMIRLAKPVVPLEPARPEPETVTFRVATYNVGDRGTADDIARLSRTADVVLLQEVGDQATALAPFTGRTIRGDGDGRSKVAVIVREGLTVRDSGHWPCTGRVDVGSLGAGPRELGPKWIAWAKIDAEDIGRAINVGSTHLVPSVQRAPFPGRSKRRWMHSQHVAALIAWAKDREGHGITILGGDFNATPDYLGLKPLRAAGFVPATKPSHGKRAIDAVWHRDQPKIHLVSVDALDGYGSDHKPVLATYAIKPGPEEVVTERKAAA